MKSNLVATIHLVNLGDNRNWHGARQWAVSVSLSLIAVSVSQSAFE